MDWMQLYFKIKVIGGAIVYLAVVAFIIWSIKSESKQD